MSHQHSGNELDRPLIAIVCPNSLTVLGLKQLLHSVMPSMEIVAYTSVQELCDGDPERFFHFFVEFNVLITDRQFFLDRKHKTIVLTTQADHQALLSQFHCLCVNVPEKQLVRSLLKILQIGHSNGKNMPPVWKDAKSILSPREAEVLALLAQGFINKEVAARLNISLATVITHRKNITEKLGIRSLSALTIYAVMNGYVSIENI